MDPVRSAPCAGRVVAGRYRLESKLGDGGMGSVWAAQHLVLDSKVAVKLLDPAVAHDASAAARFAQEAQAAAALRSPHVVQILDHGLDAGLPFIAMELLEGESLGQRLERVGCLNPSDTLRIMTEVSRAVLKAHEAGIIHRDIKPDNIFLVANDDIEIAKMLDFGIARRSRYDAEGAAITQTGAVFGSPYYMSPEQAEGVKDLDHRTDIWSLAVVVYECLLGARPFEADTLASVFLAICSRPIPVPSKYGTVPVGFDAWFARGTERDRNQRFQSVRETMLALRNVCESTSAGSAAVSPIHPAPSTAEQYAEPISTTSESIGPEFVPSLRRSRQHRWWLSAAGAALVGGMVLYAVTKYIAATKTASDQRTIDEVQGSRGPVGDTPSSVEPVVAPVEPEPSAPLTGLSEGQDRAAERAVDPRSRKSPPVAKPRPSSQAAPEPARHNPTGVRARPNPSPTASAAQRPARPGGSKVDLGL